MNLVVLLQDTKLNRISVILLSTLFFSSAGPKPRGSYMLDKYFPTELRTQPSTKNLIVSSFAVQMHLMTGTFGGENCRRTVCTVAVCAGKEQECCFQLHRGKALWRGSEAIKILTAELRFLSGGKRAGEDRFEEEFQTADRATQYPASNNESKEK